MPRPKSTLEPNKINFRESFASLKFVPRFFKEIRKVNPLLFYANLLCRTVNAILPVLMLWVGKLIIDEVVLQIAADVRDLDRLWVLVAAEFGLAILSDLLSRGISLSDALLGDQYSINTSVKIIKKTSELNLDQLEDSEFYDKLERARQQTTGRVGLMSNILTQGEDVIVILSLLTGVVAFEPWLIILLVVSIVPTIINEIKFSGTSYSLARSWTQERRELDYLRYAGASDVTAKEVKLFGLSDYLALRFKNLSDKYYLQSKKLAKQRAAWGSFFNVIGTAAYYGAYVFIIFRTVAGIFSLGDLTFLSGSFNRLRSKLQGFFTRFTQITESALYLQDYFEFLDLKYTDDEETMEKLPLPEKIQKGFEFRNVGFKYPKSEIWVVRHINFDLRAGEKLAFVGENGAGKTTLIKLLLRFYEPTEGEIMLDGVPVKEYDQTAYQQYFGVIFQDFVKFELTLRENIAMGEIGEINNQERIDRASEKSLANEVINSVPRGYDQQLGKRFKQGKDLSGGQWQKIAIARAYMKDAEVLILDEPTSALDARAETEAFDRFIKLTEGKTAVIISHRFSTVRIADRIMVLKNGSVLEIGTHEELMQNDKLYAELFRLQAAGYQ
ncbi:ABC transporter ATP-binding protein [Antarcticibacterium flavum]|uniref:ABC transporter ATP-binding protein n=1 Tax=Antarcticibacterium flavum TaxID=2058175 RepID=A0A5B7X6N7_9FLAO|nr:MULTISPECIES: ABC transporter ATP-binding protein [Antarcticibacterium]MCM4158547.1 ABC transporter ATP-binding protein [Antarcticibacterium sp. W02-3]QCY70293.1 ABC transporter ATP-binding protein [Antarcticibacterium flavum]